MLTTGYRECTQRDKPRLFLYRSFSSPPRETPPVDNGPFLRAKRLLLSSRHLLQATSRDIQIPLSHRGTCAELLPSPRLLARRPRAKLSARVANSEIKGEAEREGDFEDVSPTWRPRPVSSFIVSPLSRSSHSKVAGRGRDGGYCPLRPSGRARRACRTREFRFLSRGPRVSAHDGYTSVFWCCGR